MDKIWDRKSFEVGGHWALWRGWKNRMTMQNRQKSNAKKKKKDTHCVVNFKEITLHSMLAHVNVVMVHSLLST